MSDNKRVIRASEIGEYVFCRRAWWYHYIIGLASSNQEKMQAGAAKHVEHGQAVQSAARWQQVAMTFFVIALVLAALFVAAAVIGQK